MAEHLAECLAERIQLLRETNTENVAKFNNSIKEQLQLQTKAMIPYFGIVCVILVIIVALLLLQPCRNTANSSLDLQWHAIITDQLRVIERTIENSNHRR